MEDVIREAIREHKVLTVVYKTLTRVVEPYLLFRTKDGAVVLHAWQVSGDYEKTPPPDWCNMRLAEVTGAEPTGDRYDRPHEGYNPDSPRFHAVICRA